MTGVDSGSGKHVAGLRSMPTDPKLDTSTDQLNGASRRAGAYARALPGRASVDDQTLRVAASRFS